MGGEWIVTALAFGTIGIVIVFAVVHIGRLMNRPEHRATAQNIAAGGKSATSSVREDAAEGSYHDRPLKQRLDDSHASGHPHDPSLEDRPKTS